MLISCNRVGLYNVSTQTPSVRKNDIGLMKPMGDHVIRGSKEVTGCKTHKGFNEANTSGLCKEAGTYFETEYPHQLAAMRDTERCFGVFPNKTTMGGEDGVTCSLDQSIDLGNPSHYDPMDGSPAISMWTELEPGKASNWFFILPNIVVMYNRKLYGGLVITLSHGTSISWDGRLVRHCTSITYPGRLTPSTNTVPTQPNHVFGTFWAAKSMVIKCFLDKKTSGIPIQTKY